MEANADPATIADLVAAQAARDPAKIALTFVDVATDGTYRTELRSYADLQRNGAALAKRLAGLGLRRGDAFALMMANHPEFVEAMLAAALLGAVFVPIDPRTIGEKLSFMLEHAQCRGVVCSSDCAAAIADLGHTALSWAVTLGEPTKAAAIAPASLGYAAAIKDGGSPDRIDISAAETMMLMFTSGTTGNPKAVVISHGAYMSRARGMHGIDLGADDVLYTGLSLTHINAQGTLRIGLTSGLPVVISRKFSKRHLWPICRKFGCTVFNLLGGMIPEIYSIPESPDDADNPVRLIISAGMPADLWREYERRYGVTICEIYGSTEGGGALTNPSGAGPLGSLGKPPPGLEAAIFDDDGRRCPPLQPGELRFRRMDGEPIRVSYFRNQQASYDKTIDGWFRTGDVVHEDENGWFFFHYRIGGGVRRNGDFINTALVEAALIKSGLVSDVFVYGVATPRNVAGEKTLVAAVVPSDADFDQTALVEYCATKLQKRDIPEIIQVLREIPKTISEKPIERACIERLHQDGLLS
ncbi:AMP-binding protein [Bradyrhizobium iriomotense]|uniref:ATP-dependent acyl-CoA ligase n=1 Tax=Bradyrhizobium iriomotense TaxID=441950 RepID=A0ABQ6B0K0_9BRAD|nr:AMP-binding protein [Bradyrhizobium iriomotense]GLR86061.1 ATP-dependent acyl-CoA ligase [Bradyrhizobium iriomotense]